jgi:hypothetical protein
LNQCEQFFHGQRTLALDRTWLATYHLRGAAQTWYYALEHSFLQGHVMRRIGLSPAGTEHLCVTVSSGERLPCEGIARDVPIFVDAVPYPVTYVGLALGCFDFILGVDFLRTLGPLTWDFDAHTVAFQRGTRCITWKCEGAPPASAAQQLLDATVDAQPRLLLDRLLQQHGAIFEEQRGLPPVRPYDHQIHLLLGTTLMVVHPYRYPQL